jgi:hypothetical protein
MRCRKAQELISLALDEPLSEYDRSHLGRHLESCPDCARQRSVLMKGRELLGAGLSAPPDNFEWKVQLGIQRALRAGAVAAENPAPARRFWLPAASSAIAVATVVVVAGALWLGGLSRDAAVSPGSVGGSEQVARADAGTPDLRGAEPAVLPAVPVYGQPGWGQAVSSSRYRPVQRVGLQRFLDTPDPTRSFVLRGDTQILHRELIWLREENARLRREIEAMHSPGKVLPADSVRTVGSEVQPR